VDVVLLLVDRENSGPRRLLLAFIRQNLLLHSERVGHVRVIVHRLLSHLVQKLGKLSLGTAGADVVLESFKVLEGARHLGTRGHDRLGGEDVVFSCFRV